MQRTHNKMSWKPNIDKKIKPLYISLANKLEEDISFGNLMPGTKLPPHRELAAFLDINVSTVTRAFKICEQKGLISSVVGRGTFVSYDTPSKVKKKSRIIDLGSMIPETISQNQTIDLLFDMMKEPDFRKVFQYYSDSVWQKRAAAKLLNSIGLASDEKSILISSGAQNAICAIFVTLLKENKRLATNMLVYSQLERVAKLFDIELIPIGNIDGKISAEDIEKVYSSENVSAVYLMPDMQDPTNYTMSLAEREAIADVCKKYDILIIEDGINSLLMQNKNLPIATFAPDNTVYILSLSYAGVPALRIAYMSVPKRYYNVLKDALYSMNISQSGLLLEIASRLILSGDFNSLLEKRIDGLKKRNELVDNVFKGFDIKGCSRSLGRWVILPKGVLGSEIEHNALIEGVNIYAGKRFSVVGKDINAVRLAICAPENLAELEEGLKIVKRVVEMI